jgi:hypothetical protein
VRNVWKGLVIGGLTGVVAGIALDLANRGTELSGAAAKRAVDLAPKAADRLKSAATTGVARVQDAVQDSEFPGRVRDQAKAIADAVQDSELPGRVRDQAKAIAHRLAESDATDHAREKLERAAKKGTGLAHSVMDAVPTPGAD